MAKDRIVIRRRLKDRGYFFGQKCPSMSLLTAPRQSCPRVQWIMRQNADRCGSSGYLFERSLHRKNEMERAALQALACQAWRYHHARQTHLCEAPRLAAAWVAAELKLSFVAPHLEAYCAALFKILDGELRASSAVECIHSVIRLRQGA